MYIKYDGFLTPQTDCVVYITYYIDWRCPQCGSEAVQISKAVDGSYIMDGSPSTLDEMSEWICEDCGHKSDGERMVRKKGPETIRTEPLAKDWWRKKYNPPF